MDEALRIRVLNHEKYNPRKDVATSSWVRFEHNFFTHPDFIDFTIEERIAWLYILCHASMKRGFEFELSVPHFVHVSSMCASRAKNALHQAIEKLQRRQIVKVVTSRGRYADVTRTCSTNERTNERNETNVTDEDSSLRSLSPPQSEVPPVVGAVSQFAGDPVCRELLKGVTTKAQRAWIEVYPDTEWLGGEIRKAHAWIASNPRRAPKQMARFLANWFSRAYEAYRKNQPVNATTATRNADVLRDMHRRVREGKL